MQTEVSTDSLDDSTRRLLGYGIVFRIAYKDCFKHIQTKQWVSNTLFGHYTLQTDENVIQYVLYGVLL